MYGTYLDTRRVLALLTLNREVDESLLRDDFGVVIMVRVLEIDQVSPFQPKDRDPLELRVMPGLIVFFHTGIDAPSAADTSRKFKTIPPKGVGKGFLGADLKFPAVFS